MARTRYIPISEKDCQCVPYRQGRADHAAAMAKIGVFMNLAPSIDVENFQRALGDWDEYLRGWNAEREAWR